MPNFKTFKSRSRIFTRDDILDLVYDYGQTVSLCQVDETAPADPEIGIPAQKTLRCRDVRGYTRVDSGQEMAVNEGLGINASGYTAYVYGGDVRVDQLTATTMIAFQGGTYHLYLIQAHGDKESEIWLELRLLRSQGWGTVDQPDEITESTPVEPTSLVVPIEEQDPLFQP